LVAGSVLALAGAGFTLGPLLMGRLQRGPVVAQKEIRIEVPPMPVATQRLAPAEERVAEKAAVPAAAPPKEAVAATAQEGRVTVAGGVGKALRKDVGARKNVRTVAKTETTEAAPPAPPPVAAPDPAPVEAPVVTPPPVAAPPVEVTVVIAASKAFCTPGLDGQLAQVSPLETRVKAGRHRVQCTLPGASLWSTEVEIGPTHDGGPFVIQIARGEDLKPRIDWKRTSKLAEKPGEKAPAPSPALPTD
jgi:hypothetical protein